MSQNKSDKMGSMPVGKLLFSMSIPAIFSMLIQAMYNIVDTIYVAQLGEQALYAIGLVFPLQMLIISFSLGASVGTSALVSRRLGEKKQKEASEMATAGMLITLFHSIVLACIGLFFSKTFLGFFTKDATVVQMGYDYLIIVMGLSVGASVAVLGERVLQSTGNMIVPMFAQLLGAITNIILDPIFIFGYFGVPAMGITGAAIATVIGQFASMLFVLGMFRFGKHDVRFVVKGFKFNFEHIKEIYKIGIPVLVMNVIGSVTTTAMNTVLVSFSEVGVTVLSLYFKLQSFVFMPIFGMTQGALPILSYNFGARNKKRFMDTVKLALIASVSIMFVGMVVFWVFPAPLLQMFKATGELLEVGTIALRTISLCFMLVGVSIVMNTIFNSLGFSFLSMLMSLMRQLIFIIPCAFIFGKLWGMNAVWYAYLVAEGLTTLIFIPRCIKSVNTSFANLGEVNG